MSFSIINPSFGKTIKGNSVANSITYDSVYDISNNIYVCGAYSSNYVRTNGIPITTNIVSNKGFIAKYDTSYNLVWINIINSNGLSQILGVGYLNNNIYIGGTYVSSLTVTLSGGLTLPASGTSTWSFFSKINTNGNILFANTISGVSTSLNNIYTSGSSLYIVGGYQSTGATVNLSGQTLPITVAGKTSSYFAVYNEDGTCTLARDISDMLTNTGIGYSISVNLSGIVVAGQEISGAGMNSYTKIFDPSTGNQLASIKIIPTTYTATNRIQIIKCATTDNNIYVVGEYYGTGFTNSSLPNASNTSAFMIIYDNALNEIYNRRIVTIGSARCIYIYGSDIYVAGYYNSATTVDLSNGITIPASNLNDGLLIKYDLSGITLDALPIHDNGINSLSSSLYNVIRNSTRILIGGTYNNITDITLSGGIILKTNGYNALSDYFIEYDTSLNIAYGTNSIYSLQNTNDSGFGVAEYNNIIYTCGTYIKSISFPSDISDTIPISRNTFRNAIITSYDSSGNLLWANTVLASSDSQFLGIIANEYGVFVTGYYSSATTVDLGNGQILPISIGIDSLLIKYDFCGNAIWFSTIRDGTNSGTSTCISAYESDIFIAGRYASNSSVTISGSDVVLPSTAGIESGCVIKYNSNGIAQWASTTVPASNIIIIFEAIAASANNVIVGGRFRCIGTQNDLDLSNGVIVPASYLGFDRGFIATYNTSGTALWARYIDSSSNSEIKSVGYNANHIYIGGSYNTQTGTLSGYLSPSTSIILPPTSNITKAVLGKYDFCGNVIDGVHIPSGNISIMRCIKVLDKNILYGMSYNSPAFIIPRGSIVMPASLGIDCACIVYDLSFIPITFTRITEQSNDANFFAISSTYTSLYLTGTYNNSTTIDLGNGVILPRTAGIDYLNVKYDIFTIPPTPINIVVTPLPLSILLNWTPSAHATSYTVSYGISGSFTSTQIFLTASGIILSLMPGTFYNFRISATGTLGTSFESSIVYGIPALPIPDIPTIVSAVAIPNGAIIEWTSSLYATGYMVSYGISGVFDTAFATMDLSGIFEELIYNIPYNFKVRAYNDSGFSLYSTVVYVIPLPTIVGVPFIIEPTAIGRNEITIISTIPVGIITYRIAYSEINGNFENIIDFSDNVLEITYLKPDTSYKFIIIAIGVDTLAYSDIIYKTTLSIPSTQTSTGNSTSGSVITRNKDDTIYNYKQRYDSTSDKIWQFRSHQERISYLQSLTRNFTPK